LLAAKVIPDPFVNQNEADLQWIDSKTWVYSTTFNATSLDQDECLDLVLGGLDTFATVKLNGTEILQ
jgi:beta-mannosidase